MTHLGPTGQFPHGKLTPDDEGELRCAVLTDPIQKKIILTFGTPIAWLGLEMGQAEKLGALLIETAKKLRT